MRLDEFAAKYGKRGGNQCFTCALPSDIRAEITRNRRAMPPVSYNNIAKWLKAEHGMTAGASAIRQHYAHGHEPDEGTP